ncbi:MAG: alkaline phosphatase family protein [Proteobacteria bacterium]|nr:alkaline phosphatase family protein [Pseudomonadota bacterium]
MKRAWLAAVLAALCGVAQAETPRRAVVLGVDGLDPAMTRELVARDLLPNIKRVMDNGGFMPLGTANPPQSPVAWSNFITGMDPGGHGLFDFPRHGSRNHAALPVVVARRAGHARAVGARRLAPAAGGRATAAAA